MVAENEEARQTRNDPNRDINLAELERLKEEVRIKEEKVDRLKKTHPDRLKENANRLQKAKDEANFYTGNLFDCKTIR